MVEKQLTVRSEQGLHGRPADLFVRTANRYSCHLSVRNISSNSGPVNAKSILKILSLGVYHGHVIQISAEGVDEEKALKAITGLIRSNFKLHKRKDN